MYYLNWQKSQAFNLNFPIPDRAGLLPTQLLLLNTLPKGGSMLGIQKPQFSVFIYLCIKYLNPETSIYKYGKFDERIKNWRSDRIRRFNTQFELG